MKHTFSIALILLPVMLLSQTRTRSVFAGYYDSEIDNVLKAPCRTTFLQNSNDDVTYLQIIFSVQSNDKNIVYEAADMEIIAGENIKFEQKKDGCGTIIYIGKQNNKIYLIVTLADEGSKHCTLKKVMIWELPDNAVRNGSSYTKQTLVDLLENFHAYKVFCIINIEEGYKEKI
jgi:hypothetical protein